MNAKFSLAIAVAFSLILLCCVTFAAPPPPPPAPTPIDGGLSLLVLGGIGYASKKFYDRSKK
jgi:hypothetical protein